MEYVIRLVHISEERIKDLLCKFASLASAWDGGSGLAATKRVIYGFSSSLGAHIHISMNSRLSFLVGQFVWFSHLSGVEAGNNLYGRG